MARGSKSKVSCLVRDVRGAEGPLVTRDGRIFLTSPPDGRVVEVLADGTARDLVKYEGIPTGLQLDRQGDLWVADMKHGLLRATLDGRITTEVATFEGEAIRGCNDCCFDQQGNLYFTAPAGSSQEKAEGEVFCRLADRRVVRLDGGYRFCNGIALAADDRLLIVGEMYSRTLWAYDLPAPGQAVNKRLWARLPGHGQGSPDGMDFDAEGNLLVAHWGGGAIEVFSPQGKHLERIHTPFDHPSNLHFNGPGSRELLITDHDHSGLWRTHWRCPGQRQYGWGEVTRGEDKAPR